MCGILGEVNFEGYINKALFEKQRDTLIHRGPDSYGTYLSKDKHVALGHRRLSIIDLSEYANQPITNEDKTIWLVFNGEIYNFQDLRELLQSKGHVFCSQTDSECIIHAYEEWREQCVSKLWGMFAFVIWDESKQLLFGARDRLGVKPLHYYHENNRFICASEIKAIVTDPDIQRQLDRSAICDYLTYRYIPAPKTIWSNIRKLPPAHAFTLNQNVLKIWNYWQLEPQDKIISEEKAVEHLGEILADAVKRRLISDVPLGLFLSGGLDSTAIAWQMAGLGCKTNSFTIGFSEIEKDETADAALVAKHFGTNHNVEYLSNRELEQLSDLMWYFDEPFGASSMLPTFLVSKTARKEITVALSGDGGDEALAGYNWYDTLLTPGPNSLWRNFFRKQKNTPENLAERYRQVTTPRFTRPQLQKLFNDNLNEIESDELWFFKQNIHSDLNGVKRLQWLDTHTFLPEEVLTKVDRASMANSLEVRSPFLDHRIFEWSFSLSDKVYFKGNKKLLIKKLLQDHVPTSIINKKKQGFSVPVSQYWNDQKCNHILNDSSAVTEGLFDKKYIKNLVNDTSINNYAERWLLVIFELWYQKWVSNPSYSV